MPERIPQGVAKRVLLKAYLASDHVTPATGKTIPVVISKNGGAFGNPDAGATNATEIASGWYRVDLAPEDVDVEGPLAVRATEGTIDDIEKEYEVSAAMARQDRAAISIVLATVGDASTVTSIVTSSLDPAATVTDQFKGRVLIFDKDTTTAELRGQATRITTSTTGGVLAVEALSTAPVNGDKAAIL